MASVTPTETAFVPATVGVPATVIVGVLVPVAVTPAGSPVTVHVYGAVPPTTVSEPVYGIFTVPVAGNAPEIVGGFGPAITTLTL